MKKTLFAMIIMMGSLQAATSSYLISEAYQTEGLGAACKAAGGQFTSTLSEHQGKAFVVGLGALAMGGYYAWSRWYNQLEKQILRAATSGNIDETGKLLEQLVANVNAAAGAPEFAKKQVATLNIFRDIFTQVEKVKSLRTLVLDWDGLFAKVNEIGSPYYVAWILAELEPVTAQLFGQKGAPYNKFLINVEDHAKHVLRPEVKVINGEGNKLNVIFSNIITTLPMARHMDNERIEAENPDNPAVVEVMIARKYSRACQAANAITNTATKQAVLRVIPGGTSGFYVLHI